MSSKTHCRICLIESRGLQSIYEINEAFCVISFIHSCMVSIHENDVYGDRICTICLDKIKIAHEIRLTCIQSDRFLKSQVVLEIITVASSQIDLIKLEEADAGIAEYSRTHLSTTPIPISAASEIEEDFSLGDGIGDEISECLQEQIKTQSVRIRRIRTSEKNHMCSICGKTFHTSGHLKSHELIHNDLKNFTCNYCSKNFLKKSYLNRHIKSHVNARNYKCKTCGKGFNTSTTLGYHFRLVHSGETTFQCSFCDKAFPLKIQLVSHTRSHTGEKPHKCDHCQKKYSHKIDLKRHMMLHTGNKAYKCPYCDRTFTKKSNMECHIPTHTGEKPYKCNICFKDFRQPCPYKKHMQTHSEVNEQTVKSTGVVLEQTINVNCQL